ncbi:MAG: AraC family transcriptional regulator [Candidatus Didemnitutus sp.]|nr:AraC family transcriptional regulator [Candidatus Didemnitutus sp.]
MRTATSLPGSAAPSADVATRRLAELLSELATGEGFSASRLPGVRFMRSTIHVPRSPIAYDPGLCLIAQGTKIGHFGERRVVYDAHNYLALAAPTPFECETRGSARQPVLGLFVTVPPALIAELLLQMNPGDERSSNAVAVQTAPLDADMIGAAERLVANLREPEDARILAPHGVREIVYRALRGPLGGSLRALAAPDSHFGQISRVLHRLHTDFAQPVGIETLAREAGMSASTFHARFKQITSSSPVQYLKALRLHKARLLMVHDGLNASSAAHRVGYESVSQFSREFKRLFGATPAAAAGQLREALVRLA